MAKMRHDMIGQRFGRLVVQARAPSEAYFPIRWSCLCDCGTTLVVVGQKLRGGRTKSCGCFRRDHTRWAKTTHGQSKTPEWNTWSHMRRRCGDPRRPEYKNYGGRGIIVCERWQDSFANFLADMGLRPGPGYSIERVNNDGPYSPENCKWLLKALQSKNRRNLRRFTAFGKTQTIAEWARELGINSTTLRERLFERNWPLEEALSRRATPNKGKRPQL